MRLLTTLIILASTTFLSAQKTNISGDYQQKLGSGNHIETFDLTLNKSGTFLFHWYRHSKYGIPKEENKCAKGTWEQNGKLIEFFTTEKDIDEKHELNFQNSKVRFITKSPRDKSDRIINDALLFYESDIFWMKGKKLILR